MIIKVQNSNAFQILSSAMVIGPSQTGYQLEVAADGRNFSPLFSVGPNVTRQATNLSSGAYYRLNGNVGEVSVNWVRSCVTEGGGDSSELQPIDYFPLDAVEGTVISYTGSSSASGVYQFDGTEWTAVVDLDPYWTSAQTQSAITAVEDHLYDVEEVTASALTELHDNIRELSGTTSSALTELHDNIQELSGTTSLIQDTFSAYTPTTGFSTINGSAITNGGDIVIQGGGGGSTEEIELPIAAAVNDLKGNIEARLNQKYYTRQEVNDIAARKTEPGQVDAQIKNYVDPAIAEVNETIVDKELPVSAALNDLNTNKVSGVGITKIQSISQANYDALAEKDPATLYIIKN